MSSDRTPCVTLEIEGTNAPIFKAGSGCRHIVVCGGSAASRHLALLHIISRAWDHDLMSVWLAKGSFGTSSLKAVGVDPSRNLLTWDDARGMLAAARILADRQAAAGFEPAPDQRVALLVFNESLTAPATAALFGDVAAMSRTSGVALVLATEDGTLSSLADIPEVRSGLSHGNVLVVDLDAVGLSGR